MTQNKWLLLVLHVFAWVCWAFTSFLDIPSWFGCIKFPIGVNEYVYLVPCEPNRDKVIWNFSQIQAGKEGSLLQTLQTCMKDVSSSILSSIITESAARFGEDRVTQLLDDQSAVHVLLREGTGTLQLSCIANAYNSLLWSRHSTASLSGTLRLAFRQGHICQTSSSGSSQCVFRSTTDSVISYDEPMISVFMEVNTY